MKNVLHISFLVSVVCICAILPSTVSHFSGTKLPRGQKQTLARLLKLRPPKSWGELRKKKALTKLKQTLPEGMPGAGGPGDQGGAAVAPVAAVGPVADPADMGGAAGGPGSTASPAGANTAATSAAATPTAAVSPAEDLAEAPDDDGAGGGGGAAAPDDDDDGPGGGGGGGDGADAGPPGVDSDECVAEVKEDGSCKDDGSSSYVNSTLSYSAETGQFTGAMVTNQCNAKNDTEFDAQVRCVELTFPAEGFETPPNAAPGLGVLGYSFFGEQINGALDAGFTEGQVCEDGICDSGTDLSACALQLYGTCTLFDPELDDDFFAGDGVLQEDGTIDVLNDCGGHADPVHYHADMVCHYNAEDSAVHSPAVGVMIDGRGIYGRWEGNDEMPALDACNGHFGTVPANETLGVESTCVYHYHWTEEVPYSIGCYGPVESLAECRELYTVDESDDQAVGCMDGFSDLLMADEAYGEANLTAVDVWCTCYNHSEVTAGSCDAAATTAGDASDATASDEAGASVTTVSYGPHVATSAGVAVLFAVSAGALSLLFA